MAWQERYELTYEGNFNAKIAVRKFTSRVTRLKVVLATVPGPLVHGNFCIGTEDTSDDGLPHILEHAIFLGSEDYPHKGVLDKVATRCFSNGTNASTDTDVTIYEVSTAGQEGFCNILPIYLEHILFPNLTDAAYTTEVHHIDGQGRDAGTVYSEMQERENTPDDLINLTLQRALYPSPLCGYRYRTGGLLKNIRTSTNNEKVRNFHKRFYRPENLAVVVVGVVDEEKFFNVLSSFEEKVISKGLSSSFKRPWQTPVDALTSSSILKVSFPSDEEDEGQVTVAWRGPNVNDTHDLMATSILLEYLQDSAVSPLYQAFVELPQPLCADIEYSVFENIETALVLCFSSVPLHNLPLIQPKLMEVLKAHTEIDMPRMASLINNRSVHTLNDLESSPASTLANDLCIDFLYAASNTHTEARLNVRTTLDRLLNMPASFWSSHISSLLLNKPHVTVIATPSGKLVEENQKQEEERVEERKKQLGTQGLLDKASVLAASIAENEKAIPDEVLQAIKVPSLSSIQHHSISTFSNHPATHSIGVFSFNNTQHDIFKHLPITFHLHHIDTSFVTTNILMDCSKLPSHLLPYLTLFNELLFESPLHLDAGEEDYKVVVARLVEQTVEHTASVGWAGDRFVSGEFASYLHFCIKVEEKKYREGVTWCRDLLTGVLFKEDRLRSVASKCLGDATTGKKDARVLMEQLNSLSVFQKDSPIVATSMIKQLSFLKQLLDRKNNSKDLESLRELQRALVKTENMLVHVTANLSVPASTTVSSVGDFSENGLCSVWQEVFVDRLMKFAPGGGLIDQWPAKRDLSYVKAPSLPSHIMMGVGSTDSSYLTLHTTCITDFNHPDYPSLLTLCYFINMLEGPLWRAIRGNGLAYSFGINFDVNQGLNFRLLGSTNLSEAFRHAHLFMASLCDGKVQISQSDLECARCDCIFELLSMEETPQQAAERAFLCTLRNLPQNFYSKLIEQIGACTSEQLSRAACEYLKPLLHNNTAVITCPIKQTSQVAKNFNDSFQLKFTVYKQLDKIPY